MSKRVYFHQDGTVEPAYSVFEAGGRMWDQRMTLRMMNTALLRTMRAGEALYLYLADMGRGGTAISAKPAKLQEPCR